MGPPDLQAAAHGTFWIQVHLIQVNFQKGP